MDSGVPLGFGRRRMSRPASPTPLPPQRQRRFRRWLWRLAFVVAACWGLYCYTHPPPPSVTLPDGTVVTFLSVSRGKPDDVSPSDRVRFRHEPVTNDSAARRAWGSFRDHCPSWLSRILPAWPLRTYFDHWAHDCEFELRFLVKGGSLEQAWGVGIADDDGWETAIPADVWSTSDQSSGISSQRNLNELWFPCPLPRRSRLLRIRFRPVEEDKAGLAEMVIPNPYYEGPAPPSSVSAGPVTKATRFGDITLARVERQRRVGPGAGDLLLEFQVRKDGRPVPRMSLRLQEITDRSGQYFDAPHGNGESPKLGLYPVRINTAPWSDDLVWKVRMEMNREYYSENVDESELYRFEHLPVLEGQRTVVNRSLTRNGVTFRICAIERAKNNDVIVGIECFSEGGHRMILIQDVRDDQGRTRWPKENDTFGLISGSVGDTTEGQGYLLTLPPDAKWWDLTLVAEKVETVEFEVRPTFIK